MKNIYARGRSLLSGKKNIDTARHLLSKEEIECRRKIFTVPYKLYYYRKTFTVAGRNISVSDSNF